VNGKEENSTMTSIRSQSYQPKAVSFTVHRSPFTLLSSGFTLIELLVVIAVLGLLAGLVGPRIVGHVSEARSTTARTQIDLLGVALDSYRLDNGSYPTTEQGLAALRDRPTREPIPPNWRGPYLRKPVPLDPWGRPYIYRAQSSAGGSAFELGTLGRDGKPGGDGEDADISGA
jgi:general secretion pathway protein G